MDIRDKSEISRVEGSVQRDFLHGLRTWRLTNDVFAGVMIINKTCEEQGQELQRKWRSGGYTCACCQPVLSRYSYSKVSLFNSSTIYMKMHSSLFID